MPPHKLSKFQSESDSNYTISFVEFDVEDLELELSTNVFHVVLNKDDNNEDDDYRVLNFLSNEVFSIIEQENCLLFYYCEHTAIKKSERNKHLSNQEYRNALFNALFEKKKRNIPNFNFVIRNIHIPIPGDGSKDHYSSIISLEDNIDDVILLSDGIINVKGKEE